MSKGNRERLERAEAKRVAQAKKSTIPGMVSHRWNGLFYADAMRAVANRRRTR